MYRRTSFIVAPFVMGYKQGTGTWDEDFVNDFNANKYMSARSTLRWYYEMERYQTRRTLTMRQRQQSQNNNMGLHHSGHGAFEREVERRGLPVEKYPLTTTTGAQRVAELVVLRRRELEKKAAKLLAEHAKKIRRDAPSDWFDERNGPLNPRFVERMQSHYAVKITPLPEEPLVHDVESGPDA